MELQEMRHAVNNDECQHLNEMPTLWKIHGRGFRLGLSLKARLIAGSHPMLERTQARLLKLQFPQKPMCF